MSCEWLSFEPICDIPNWFTMIIELTIGGIVGTIFFIRQQKQSKKLEQLAHNEEQNKQKRETWAKGKLIDHLSRLNELLTYQIDTINELYFQLGLDNTKSGLDNVIRTYDNLIKSSWGAFDAVIEQSIGLIDPQIIHECQNISRLSKQKQDYFDSSIKISINANFKSRIKTIESILQKLQSSVT